MIAIVDYGMGNLRSVEKALERVGAEVCVTDDPRILKSAEKIVVPGVGAFDRAVRELKDRGLWTVLGEWLESGKPFLGLCVGFQLLFDASEEGAGAKGLGVFKGRVRRFSFKNDLPRPLKIPHMGWNEIRVTAEGCPLLAGIDDKSYVYFVHSFYAQAEDPSCKACETDYGEPFTSMVWKDRIFGTQFHPEKSQAIGLTLLKNFVAL